MTQFPVLHFYQDQGKHPPPSPWSLFASFSVLSDILIRELRLILSVSLLERRAWLIGLEVGMVWLFQVPLCQLRSWQLSWDQSAGSISSDLCPLRSPGPYMKPAFLSRNFLCLLSSTFQRKKKKKKRFLKMFICHVHRLLCHTGRVCGHTPFY